MRNIIAVSGTKNVGKTTSIKRAMDLFMSQHPQAVVKKIKNRKDVIVVVTITLNRDGVQVTIVIIFASAGDAPHVLQDLLHHIREENCDILICATKKRGQTVEIIEELGDAIIWINKEPSGSEVTQEADNERVANEILNRIRECLRL